MMHARDFRISWPSLRDTAAGGHDYCKKTCKNLHVVMGELAPVIIPIYDACQRTSSRGYFGSWEHVQHKPERKKEQSCYHSRQLNGELRTIGVSSDKAAVS